MFSFTGMAGEAAEERGDEGIGETGKDDSWQPSRETLVIRMKSCCVVAEVNIEVGVRMGEVRTTVAPLTHKIQFEL